MSQMMTCLILITWFVYFFLFFFCSKLRKTYYLLCTFDVGVISVQVEYLSTVHSVNTRCKLVL